MAAIAGARARWGFSQNCRGHGGTGRPKRCGETLLQCGRKPLYSSAVASLYRAHDLHTVIVVAQRGIDYCLTQAVDANKRKDTSLTEELRGQAKTIAYNLGSHTWPGWDEPGINIQPDDLAVGSQAAKLNLQLGEELARGPEPMSRAHWLSGAHALAAANYPEAIERFQKAAQLSGTAGNRAEQLLSQGFEAMTRIVGKIPNSQGEMDLMRVKTALLSESPGDAQFWIGQLDTAYRVFVRK